MRRFAGKRWTDCGIKAVMIFMAVVIVGTFVSRFASSALTPRVETEYAVSGTVSMKVLQDVVIDGDKKTAGVYLSRTPDAGDICQCRGKD